jgi:hypothetical protein
LFAVQLYGGAERDATITSRASRCLGESRRSRNRKKHKKMKHGQKIFPISRNCVVLLTMMMPFVSCLIKSARVNGACIFSAHQPKFQEEMWINYYHSVFFILLAA